MKIAPLMVFASLVSVSLPVPAQHCAGGICELTVIVPGGCGSGIQVAPNPVRVPSGEKATTMTWVIRSSKGWTFDPKKKGIDLGSSAVFSGGAAGETKDAAKLPTYTVTNNHTAKTPAKGNFKYDINLMGPDNQPCQVDPTVINQ